MGIIWFLIVVLATVLVAFIAGFFLGRGYEIESKNSKREKSLMKGGYNDDRDDHTTCQFRYHDKYVKKFGWCTACGSDKKIE